MQTSPDPQRPAPSLLLNLLKIFAVCGIVALLFVGARDLMKKREKEKQAMEEFDQTRRDMGAEMKRELDQNGSISTDTAAKAMDKMRGQLDKLATQGGKEDKTMKAAAEVMGDLQAKFAPYLTLIKQIETTEPMDMRTVKDKADLAGRRELGKSLLAMSQDILSFMSTVESRLREKLKQTGASSSSSEEFVKGFMKGFSKSASIQRRIRMTDATMAKALIAMTDLMEEQWGKWKVENAKMVFNDPAAAKHYTELVDETVNAADEQAAAQRELIELQQRK